MFFIHLSIIFKTSEINKVPLFKILHHDIIIVFVLLLFFLIFGIDSNISTWIMLNHPKDMLPAF
jgi:hypothetical protein